MASDVKCLKDAMDPRDVESSISHYTIEHFSHATLLTVSPQLLAFLFSANAHKAAVCTIAGLYIVFRKLKAIYGRRCEMRRSGQATREGGPGEKISVPMS